MEGIKLTDGLERINKLELINALGVLKVGANNAEEQVIDNLLNTAKCHLAKSHTSLDLSNKEESIRKIKNLLMKDSQEIEDNIINFSFEIRAVATEQLIDDMNRLGLTYTDYTMTIGNRTIVNIDSNWNKMNKDDKITNMQLKYVRNDEKIKPKTAFSLATTFLQSHASESRRCIAFLDPESRKFPNWQAICINLRSLAHSSGYTESDVKQSLLSFIREFNLDQSLYESLEIDDIAVQLIKSVKPVDKLALLWQSLRNIERPVGSPLQLVLASCESYINKLFPEQNKLRQRENQKLLALCSFVSEKIGSDITKDIKLRRESNEDISYEYYRSVALRLEQLPENVPNKILKYGKNNKNITDGTLELWNTQMNNISLESKNNEEIRDEEKDSNYMKFNGQGAIPRSRREQFENKPIRNNTRKNFDYTHNLNRVSNNRSLSNDFTDRNDNSGKSRDLSRERYNDQDRYDNHANRDSSRNRFNNGERNRDYSRDKFNNVGRYREVSRERFRDGEIYEHNRENTARYYDDQRSQHRAKNIRTEPRTDNRSRDRSRDLRLAYLDMKRGFNCERDYDPNKVQFCRKCIKLGNPDHHEFLCRSFVRFNYNICKKCLDGFHFERECKSGSTTSYSTDASTDNVEANHISESDRLDKIIRLLKL